MHFIICVLAGKSWGGGMALEVVRANRAPIKKVVLIAPAGAPKLLPAFLSDTGTGFVVYVLRTACIHNCIIFR